MSAIENQSAIPSRDQASSRAVPVWSSHFGLCSTTSRYLTMLRLLGTVLCLILPFSSAHADAVADYCASFALVKSWQGYIKMNGSGSLSYLPNSNYNANSELDEGCQPKVVS